MTPGRLDTAATTQSIGLRWLVSGDTDHDAVATVEFRESGDPAWREAMPLVRVDSSNGNTLAGSIMFLSPDTDYEVQIAMSDPDGGAETRSVTVRTAALPVKPTPARVLHVIPGSGGGDGSESNPFQGIGTAWEQARPGDELRLHAGTYVGVTDDNKPSGTEGNPIVFRAAGDGEVVIPYMQVFQSSNLWFEQLTLRYDGTSDTGFYASLLNDGYDNGFQSMMADVDNIVFVQNRVEGYKHGVRAGPRTSGWYIADNVIVGNKTLGMSGTESFDGEGIELGHGSNHEVAFNSITLVADGVSFPEFNCDIYGNDIFDVTDDGIELDNGRANTRIWQNRIHNAGHNGVAFQPQSGAPWYIVRNQIVNMQESVFKFRSADRFVAVHNTFVNWNSVLDHWSHQLFRGITRNNLWISLNNGPIWRRGIENMSWRTDLDYDGFDWGSNSAPFEVNGTKYRDLAELRAATGQQMNGIRIDAPSCLETLDVPGPPPLTTVPAQWMTLMPSCSAVDSGVVIPNLSDTFTGSAPDLGAYEVGAANPHYGPRTDPPSPGNRAPAANAGSDTSGDEGTAITLSGSLSSDPDGDPLSYAWSQSAGPAALIDSPDQATTSVGLPQVSVTETLVFQLTVTDPSGLSSADTVSVTVIDTSGGNGVPAADAGPDRTAAAGSRVTLTGDASDDPDGDTLTYAWAQTAGTAAAILDPSAMNTAVDLPQLSVAETLTFQLTVTDSSGLSDSDLVTVSVTVSDSDGSSGDSGGSGGGSPAPLGVFVLAVVWLMRSRRLAGGAA